MNMMIIGISGSPRKGGNTDKAVSEALADVRERGVNTRFIRIYDHRIESCQGCRKCMDLGHCVIQDDDLEDLLSQLAEADGCIMGAPVYWNGPPGKMKDFIDRSHGYYSSKGGTLLRDLKYSLLSIATASGFDPHENVMSSWIDYYGARMVGKERIYARDKGDLDRRPSELDKAKRAARCLVHRLND